MKDENKTSPVEQELYNLFISPHFIRSLQKAGLCTYQTGHETGFTVDKDRDGKLWMGKVAEGLCGKVVYGLDKLDFDTEDMNPETAQYLLEHSYSRPQKERSRYLWFHFHPLVNAPIIPSDKDLEIITNREIGGIGQISENKNIEVLLLQPTSKYILLESSLDKLNAECETTSQVAEFLERSGLYRSIFIQYEFLKKRNTHRGNYHHSFSQDIFSGFFPLK